MKRNFYVLTLLLLNSIFIFGQNAELSNAESSRYFRIMFYNAENFFDIRDDSLTNDNDFLPEGGMHWTSSKFNRKRDNLAKVITSVGGWQLPDIVGLCEIESRYCLESLCRYSPLKNAGYKIIHKESPDPRGIDVALLYRDENFQPLFYEAIRAEFPSEPNKKTRDILYVKGFVKGGDTLYIFVNHWPSRLGGQLESEENRMTVASVVRKNLDSIFHLNPAANIVLVGDFNDYPDNEAITKVLGAKTDLTAPLTGEIYNLSYPLQFEKGKGSHKFGGNWGILDQIIVSGNLLSGKSILATKPENSHIHDAEFLLVDDETNLGKKLFRTFEGMRYIGGFSDHLPVFLDIFFTKDK
jgi:predicted extracellular nuclease